MAEPKHFDQEFVEYLVGSIVDNPEEVRTERIVDDLGTLISLHVNPEDMATIIGKEGRTAKSLRTLLRVLGAKHDQRINLKIIEPEGGKMFGQNDESERARLEEYLKDVPTDEIA